MATRQKEVIVISEHDVLKAQMDALGIKGMDHVLDRAGTKDRIYHFMVDYCKAKGRLPTVKCIADSLSLSPSTTRRLLEDMVRMGRVLKHGTGRDGRGVYIPVVV